MIWGSTWIAINFQYGPVALSWSLVYRFALAALLLFVYCLWRRLPLGFSWRQHLWLLLLGGCLFGLNYLLIYQGQQYLNSALTAIIFSTLVVMNLLNGRLWFGYAVEANLWRAAALGLMGIVTLFWPQLAGFSLTNDASRGLLLCLLATFVASCGNMVSVKIQRLGVPVVQGNAWGMAYGATLMALWALSQGQLPAWDTRWSYWLALLYLSLFGSVIGFGSYLALLRLTGPGKAGYVTVMFPAVALLLSTLFEGFVWTPYSLAGFALIVAGNVMILRRGARS